jgi:cytochrome b561
VPPTAPQQPRANQFAHLVTLVAANGVPAVGWFTQDWSAATTLIVYWFETVAGLLFIYARGVLQQRWNPQRGHFRYEAPQSKGPQGKPGSFIKGFLFINGVFCAAHGVFIAAILLILTHNGNAELVGLDWRSAGIGCLQMLVIVVVDFLVDVPYLRRWPFGLLEQTANRSFGRMAVVHLALILGMFVAAVTDSPARMFGVFVVLKTLYSLSTALPMYEPATPPKWLSRAMNRLRREPEGQRFEDMWVKDQAAEVRRRTRNDEVWTGAGR